jgi:thioredoxin-like negative regulator of GroEL
LDKALESESAYEAGKAADTYLLLARRLIETGKTSEALAIYRKLSSEEQPAHVRQAAMGGLLDIGRR